MNDANVVAGSARGRLVGYIDCVRVKELARYAKEGRIVFFDTETTGLDSDDEIVQISAVEYVDGRKARTYNAYIRPTLDEDRNIAEDIHGCTWDFLKRRGKSPSDALAGFFELLGDGNALVVAHNLRFDMRMLRQECGVSGREWDVRGLGLVGCDTLSLAKRLHPEFLWRSGGCGYSLGTLVDVFRLKAVNSHRAMDDTNACAKLFFALVKELEAKEIC